MPVGRIAAAAAGSLALLGSLIVAPSAAEQDMPAPSDKGKVADQASPRPVPPPVTRLLVKYREDVAPARRNGAATGSSTVGFRMEPGRAVGTRGWRVAHLPQPMTVQEATQQARKLATDPRVVAAEPSLRFTTAAVTPDDPLYAANQWDLGASYLASDDPLSSPGDVGVRTAQAWEVSKDRTAPVVAVLDTGMTVHPDLAGRWVDGYDFVSLDGVEPWTANDGDGRDADPSDPGDWITAAEDAGTDPNSGTFFQGCGQGNSSWHGTHVAGTIGATPGNATGIAGMVWNARIQPVRVLGKCGGFPEDIADAITWASGGAVKGVAANATPARVLNLSLGYNAAATCPTVLQQAITGAIGRGSVVTVAAGNSNVNANDVPLANCTGTVVVAATSAWGDRAYYSNYGSEVDLAAPGGDYSVDAGILSTWNAGTTIPGTPVYDTMQGTSMATPHVAAAAAIYLSVAGNENKTPAQVKAALEASSHPFTFSSPYAYSCYGTKPCGAGILDVAALVGARGAGGRPAAPQVASVVAGNSQLSMTWSAPSSANATSYHVAAIDNATNAVASTSVVTGTSATLSGLTNGRLYDVTVRAGNDFGYGRYLGAGQSVTVQGTPLAVPLPPTGLTGFGGDGRVALSWSAPAADATRAAVTGYEVSIGGQVITTVDQRTLIVEGLVNDQTYTIAVRANSAVGFSSAVEITLTPRAEVTATPTVTVTAPGPTVTAPGPTVTAPGPTVTAPAPTVTAPAPTVTAPGPTVTAPGPTVTAPGPTVTYTPPPVKLPQAVTAPPADARQGKKVRLARASDVGRAVEWRSTSKKVCRIVDDTVLRGTRPGKCRLTAEATGDRVYLPLRADFSVRVRK